MTNALTPTVVNVVEDSRMTPGGGVERRRRVTYMVGPYGPFSLTLPDSEFSAERVKKDMETVAVELRKLPTAA